jgi:hypothetical protein
MLYMATITSPTGVAAELASNFRGGNAPPDGHAPAQLGGRGLVRAAASPVVPLQCLRDSIRLRWSGRESDKICWRRPLRASKEAPSKDAAGRR